MIDFRIISTGSIGNATVLNGTVLLDCGVPFKDVEPFADGLKLVLLTHIHIDHFKPSTIRRLAREHPMLRFGAGAWLVEPLRKAGVPDRNIDVLTSGYSYNYGPFKVLPVPLVHDVPNQGYKVHFGNEKVIYATDTASMAGIRAENYDLYLIEANYDADTIDERMAEKKANGEFVYERRVKETHLSQQACENFVYQNMAPWSLYVFMHEHAGHEPQAV